MTGTPWALLRRVKQTSRSLERVARSALMPSHVNGGGSGACGVLDRTTKQLLGRLQGFERSFAWFFGLLMLLCGAKGLGVRVGRKAGLAARSDSTWRRCWFMATLNAAFWNSALISSKSTLSLEGEASTHSSWSSMDGIMRVAAPLAGTGATRRGPALRVGDEGAVATLLTCGLVSVLLPQLAKRVLQDVDVLVDGAWPRPLGFFEACGDLARPSCGEMARPIQLPGCAAGPAIGALCALKQGGGQRLSSLRSSAQSPSGMTWHL